MNNSATTSKAIPRGSEASFETTGPIPGELPLLLVGLGHDNFELERACRKAVWFDFTWPQRTSEGKNILRLTILL